MGLPPQVDVEGESEDTTNVDAGTQTTQTFHLPASERGVSRLSFYLRCRGGPAGSPWRELWLML